MHPSTNNPNLVAGAGVSGRRVRVQQRVDGCRLLQMLDVARLPEWQLQPALPVQLLPRMERNALQQT